nr:hypothetical protein [Tanacetum cinerariifolium]
MSHTSLSQQQTGSSQQPSQEIQEEEDETEPVPTPTSKKPGSRGKRVKTIAKKNINPKPSEFEIFEPRSRVAFSRMFHSNIRRSKSWENDENLMTRIEILYRAHEKSYFKHKSAWNFLKDKHKWNNPESTHARRNRNRVTNEEPELFGDDALPRPPGMHRIAKSQCSSNSTASSGSNPANVSRNDATTTRDIAEVFVEFYHFEAQIFLLFFLMANEFSILHSLLIESHSYQLNNQMKVWLSKEVGTGDGFAQDMDEHCYLVRKEMEERDQLITKLEKLAVSAGAARYVQIFRRRRDMDAVKLRLLRDLLRHARDETHERQLEVDVVDYN